MAIAAASYSLNGMMEAMYASIGESLVRKNKYHGINALCSGMVSHFQCTIWNTHMPQFAAMDGDFLTSVGDDSFFWVVFALGEGLG